MEIINKKIESTFEAVHDFVLDALEAIHTLEIEKIDSISFRINIMLREVLNNAVEHGNKFDKEKFVFCVIDYDEKEFVFEIQDEGNGFELDEFYTLSDGFTMKHRSRGLELIEKYNFDYKFDGNKIIVKYVLNKER